MHPVVAGGGTFCVDTAIPNVILTTRYCSPTAANQFVMDVLIIHFKLVKFVSTTVTVSTTAA
jgi:hypothetical protein